MQNYHDLASVSFASWPSNRAQRNERVLYRSDESGRLGCNVSNLGPKMHTMIKMERWIHATYCLISWTLKGLSLRPASQGADGIDLTGLRCTRRSCAQCHPEGSMLFWHVLKHLFRQPSNYSNEKFRNHVLPSSIWRELTQLADAIWCLLVLLKKQALKVTITNMVNNKRFLQNAYR